jgi:hypothetical protein
MFDLLFLLGLSFFKYHLTHSIYAFFWSDDDDSIHRIELKKGERTSPNHTAQK